MPSLIHEHLVIVQQMSKLPCFKVVAQHCISHFSGVITRNQHLGRFVLLLVRRIEKSLVFPKRSSASAMYAQHNVCIFETTILKSIYMILCRD